MTVTQAGEARTWSTPPVEPFDHSYEYDEPEVSLVDAIVKAVREGVLAQVIVGEGGSSSPSVEAVDASTTPWSLTSTPSAPGTAIRQVGRHLESVDDIFANPQLLAGEGPRRVRSILGDTPGWV